MIMDFVDLTVDSDDERRLNEPSLIHDEETLLLAPAVINPENIKTEKGPFRNIFVTVNSSAAERNPSTSADSPTTEPKPTSNNSSTVLQNSLICNNSSTTETKPTMSDSATTAEPNLLTPNISSTAEQNPSTCNNSSTVEQNPSTSTNSSTAEPKTAMSNNASTAEPTTSGNSATAKKKKKKQKGKKNDKDNVSSFENDTSNSDSETDTTSKKSTKKKKKNRKRKRKQTEKSSSEDDSASSENDDSDSTSEASSESKPKKKKRKLEARKKAVSKKRDKLEKRKSFIKEAIQDMKTESIDDDVAEIWAKILKKGLQSKKRELLQQFSYPENCKLLQAPILNNTNMIEMKINKTTVEADEVVRRRQDQLGLGIGAIGRVINLLAELTPNEKVKKSIQILTNAGQILADVHYSETEARKKAFFPKENHKYLGQLERDNTLFGNSFYNLGLMSPASLAKLFIDGPNKNK